MPAKQDASGQGKSQSSDDQPQGAGKGESGQPTPGGQGNKEGSGSQSDTQSAGGGERTAGQPNAKDEQTPRHHAAAAPEPASRPIKPIRPRTARRPKAVSRDRIRLSSPTARLTVPPPTPARRMRTASQKLVEITQISRANPWPVMPPETRRRRESTEERRGGRTGQPET